MSDDIQVSCVSKLTFIAREEERVNAIKCNEVFLSQSEVEEFV